MKNLLNKKGFTIVELVIVIAVIGILAAVLIPTFSNVIDSANESAALQEAKNELNAYNSYMATEGIVLKDGTVFEVKKSNTTYRFVYYKSTLLNITDGETYPVVTAKDGSYLPYATITEDGVSSDVNLNSFVKLSLDDTEKVKNDSNEDVEVYSYLFFAAGKEIDFSDGSDSCKILPGAVYKVKQELTGNDDDNKLDKDYQILVGDYAYAPTQPQA